MDRQSTGKTALHFAAGQDDRGSEESSVKIIQILLAVRTQCTHARSAPGPLSRLPVSRARMLSFVGSQAGSLVNCKDKLGNTPLQLAHSAGIARTLLRAGADTASVNEAGQSVLEYARQYHPLVYEIIDGWHSGDSLEESFGALREAEIEEENSAADMEAQLKRTIMDGLRKELTRLGEDAWMWKKDAGGASAGLA